MQCKWVDSMKSAEKDYTPQRSSVQLINGQKLYSRSYSTRIVNKIFLHFWLAQNLQAGTFDKILKSLKFADIITTDVNWIDIDRKRNSNRTVPYSCFGKVGENDGKLHALYKGRNTQSTARKNVLSKNTNSTQRMTAASWRISAIKIPSQLSRNRQKFSEGETLNRLRYTSLTSVTHVTLCVLVLLLNPLSPSIHIQILQTDLRTFP